MPRVATRHAHQLAYRQRFSVGVRMFGCVLLIAGSIVLAATIATAGGRSIADTPWLTLSIGLALAACGAVLLFGERGKLIDREQRTVRRWWGIAKPLWHRTRDLQTYQGVAAESCEEAKVRWRVFLLGGQGERLELFELASQDLAQAVARQVAEFLSLAMLPPGTALANAVAAQASAVPPTSDRWIHRSAGRRAPRFLGVACLLLAGFFSLATIITAASRDGRWLVWLAMAALATILGLWLLCGGRKVEVDRQRVCVWWAWPLPPAEYDLASFCAVVVATTAGEGEPETCLVGLVGPEQVRLELVGALPAVEARSAAAQLAATTNLPLIDESQPAVPSA